MFIGRILNIFRSQETALSLVFQNMGNLRRVGMGGTGRPRAEVTLTKLPVDPAQQSANRSLLKEDGSVQQLRNQSSGLNLLMETR